MALTPKQCTRLALDKKENGKTSRSVLCQNFDLYSLLCVAVSDMLLLVQVSEANCTDSRVPDQDGDCYCPSMTVQIGGSCVDLSVLNPSIIVPVVLLGLIATFAYGKYRHKAADNIWKIKFKDLKFPATPQILGVGTFGVVIRAEYYGTSVAVKRVVPVEASSSPARVDPRMAFTAALSYFRGDRQATSTNDPEKPKVSSKSGSHFDLRPGSSDPFGRAALTDSGRFNKSSNFANSGNFAPSENSDASFNERVPPMPSGAPGATADAQYHNSGGASARKNLKLTLSGAADMVRQS
jgi:hypothetical protein